MQRAGQQRTVSARATSPKPPARHSASAVVVRHLEEQLPPSVDDTNTDCGGVSSHRGARQEALEIAIQQRVASRLQGRVRNLTVRAYADLVILEGECATYYTKQLAQHAAMGVLDNEHLENAIVVNVAR